MSVVFAYLTLSVIDTSHVGMTGVGEELRNSPDDSSALLEAEGELDVDVVFLVECTLDTVTLLESEPVLDAVAVE